MRAVNPVEEVLGIFKSNGFDITISNCYMLEIDAIESFKTIRAGISNDVRKILSRGLNLAGVV